MQTKMVMRDHSAESFHHFKFLGDKKSLNHRRYSYESRDLLNRSLAKFKKIKDEHAPQPLTITA